MPKKEFPIGLPMHQIPKAEEYRRLITAPPAGWFIVADCDSQETHIITEQSKDEALIEVYHNNQNPHTLMASKIAGASYDDIVNGLQRKDAYYERMYKAGKVIDLAKNYRCGAKTTYENAHVQWQMPDVTIDEVKEWSEVWSRTYKRIPEYWRNAIYKARQLGYAETLAGRRFNIDRWIDDRWASESSAIMVPIQGTGADMKYLAIAVMRLTFPELDFWGEIHDEVIYVTRQKPTPEYLLKVKNTLDTLPYKKAWDWEPLIPFTWTVKIGQNWGELR